MPPDTAACVINRTCCTMPLLSTRITPCLESGLQLLRLSGIRWNSVTHFFLLISLAIRAMAANWSHGNINSVASRKLVMMSFITKTSLRISSGKARSPRRYSPNILRYSPSNRSTLAPGACALVRLVVLLPRWGKRYCKRRNGRSHSLPNSLAPIPLLIPRSRFMFRRSVPI